jgi:hypothetical protein
MQVNSKCVAIDWGWPTCQRPNGSGQHGRGSQFRECGVVGMRQRDLGDENFGLWRGAVVSGTWAWSRKKRSPTTVCEAKL